MRSLLLAFALATQAAGPAAPATAQSLTASKAATVAEIDTGKLKGDPWRLAWSPDGSQLYLQTVRRDRSGNATVKHYLIAAAGGAPKETGQEPPWAAKYWTWKSTQAAPGAPTFKIQLEERTQVVTSMTNLRGAGLAGLGGDPTSAGGSGRVGSAAGDPASADLLGQNALVRTLRLKGEVIGEWINGPIVPGQTFGWSPAALGVVAFANNDGEIVIMDQQGGKQTLPSSGDSLLPAWSEDGKRLAYLQKTKGNKYTLHVVDVDISGGAGF